MNVKKMLFFVAMTAAVIIASGCGSNSSKKLIKKGLYNCNGRLETAMKRIEKRNYNDAVRILNEIKYQCGGSSFMDTVYYHTAMSHFRLKQYVDARFEFENLQQEFPRSPFVEESYYRLGQMRFLRSKKWNRDQTETKEAIRLFGDYMDLYPDGVFADSVRHFNTIANEKLAEKEFRTAMFYRRQKEHEAALIYFNSLLTQYPQSKFISEATIGMVEALTAVGRVEDARETIEDLVVADFSEPLRKRLEAVILRLDQPRLPQNARNRRAGAQQQPAVIQPAASADHVDPPVKIIYEVQPEPVNNEEKLRAVSIPQSIAEPVEEAPLNWEKIKEEKADTEEVELETENIKIEAEKALPETEKSDMENVKLEAENIMIEAEKANEKAEKADEKTE
jgi:outer membrane protein assembly factor BamD